MWDEILSCGNYYPREERMLGQNVVGLFAIGTKCSWDIWLLGQNVFGTFGVWDKSLDFQIFLGQKALGQNVSGTIHPNLSCHWDKC